jgi:hypothetical protein
MTISTIYDQKTLRVAKGGWSGFLGRLMTGAADTYDAVYSATATVEFERFGEDIPEPAIVLSVVNGKAHAEVVGLIPFHVKHLALREISA